MPQNQDSLYLYLSIEKPSIGIYMHCTCHQQHAMDHRIALNFVLSVVSDDVTFR